MTMMTTMRVMAVKETMLAELVLSDDDVGDNGPENDGGKRSLLGTSTTRN